MRSMGRLGDKELVAGDAAYAVGDRVAFLGKHVTHRPRVDSNGTPLLRADGSPRRQRLTIPKRVSSRRAGACSVIPLQTWATIYKTHRGRSR
jgi:hypothetical protein